MATITQGRAHIFTILGLGNGPVWVCCIWWLFL